MRTEAQITRAHDLLVGIILQTCAERGQLAGPPPKDLEPLVGAADVLCWILEHNHNRTFAQNLVKFEAYMLRQGWRLEHLPKEDPKSVYLT